MKTPPTSMQLIAAIHSVLPDARAAWLFGSAVRNEMRADSDIDIAVWLPEAWDFQEKLSAHSLLADALNAPVDVLDFCRLSTVMQIQVLETGELLFARDPVALEMQCATLRTEYLHIQRWRRPMIGQLTAELSLA